MPGLADATRCGAAWDQDLYDQTLQMPMLHVIPVFDPTTHQPTPPLAPAQWAADYTNSGIDWHDVNATANTPLIGTIWLNPPTGASTGDLWSLGTASGFVQSAVNNITIQNLQIFGFRDPLQGAPIQAQGANWLVNNNELSMNHGYGVKTRGSSAVADTISDNYVHDNSQSGIGSSGGSGSGSNGAVVFNGNLVKWNNVAFSWPGESGGSKFAADVQLLVQNNIFDGNLNIGLWEDSLGCQKGSCLFIDNTASHNTGEGIRYELSYNGTIQGNHTNYNSEQDVSQCFGPGLPWPYCTGHGTGFGTCIDWTTSWRAAGCQCTNTGEITTVASQNVTIGGSAQAGNTTTSHCAGINTNQDGRVKVSRVAVSYNKVTVTGTAVTGKGIGGYNSGSGVPGPSPTPAGNIYNGAAWDHNTYWFPQQTGSPNTLTNFSWPPNAGVTPAPSAVPTPWAGWQGVPEDGNGSCTDLSGNC